jgi:hypothetical protein
MPVAGHPKSTHRRCLYCRFECTPEYEEDAYYHSDDIEAFLADRIKHLEFARRLPPGGWELAMDKETIRRRGLRMEKADLIEGADTQ